MLHSIKKLEHCRILATDAEVGSVSDTYFDDARWVVRYLIVETSNRRRDEIRDSPTYDPDRASLKAPSTSQHTSS